MTLFQRKAVRCVAVLLLVASGVQAQTFKIISGVGSVGKDAKSYSPIKTGAEYPLGWWARTTDAPLKLEFEAGNVFRLFPRSEVQITGTGGSITKFQRYLILKSGKIEFDFPQLNGGKVEVETPTAVCGGMEAGFTVDSSKGEFQVPKGKIYAKAKGDSTFAADSVGGVFLINPGVENSYSAGTVSGIFLVNGRLFTGSNVNFEVAKGRAASVPAAVRINSGQLGTSGPGNYLMISGALHSVDKKTSYVHAAYLIAARDEGVLNMKHESLLAAGRPIPPKLEEQMTAAVVKATELRKKLFPQ